MHKYELGDVFYHVHYNGVLVKYVLVEKLTYDELKFQIFYISSHDNCIQTFLEEPINVEKFKCFQTLDSHCIKKEMSFFTDYSEAKKLAELNFLKCFGDADTKERLQ